MVQQSQVFWINFKCPGTSSTKTIWSWTWFEIPVNYEKNPSFVCHWDVYICSVHKDLDVLLWWIKQRTCLPNTFIGFVIKEKNPIDIESWFIFVMKTSIKILGRKLSPDKELQVVKQTNQLKYLINQKQMIQLKMLDFNQLECFCSSLI